MRQQTRQLTLPLTLARRRVLLASLGAVVSPAALSAGPALPTPDALAAELARALAGGNPLVVMVSLEGCPICKLVRESYLRPLWQRNSLPVVQLDMHSTRAVADFAGQPATHEGLIHRWGINLAPTVLFFGPQGREVAERLSGGYLPDFYGAYLEDRLQLARLALRAPKAAPPGG
jgi:hypothetical protein